MSFYKALIVTIIVAFFLTSCGAAPRPFRAMSEEDKYSNPLLEQRDGVGINIHVIDSTSPETEIAVILEQALLQALELAHIPATAGGELSNGHQLMGRSYVENGESIFRWTLFNQYGQGLGEGLLNIADNPFDPEISKYVADNVSDEIAEILKPENMQALEVVSKKASVAIIEVTGAPGDGDDVLPKAMRLMLQEANVATTADPASAILHVTGKVKLISKADGMQTMRIVWLFNRANGEELGSITQENDIPPGSLDMKWGDSAYDVAYAMVDTVARALEVAKNSD